MRDPGFMNPTGGLPTRRWLRSIGRGTDRRGDEALAPSLPLLSLFLVGRRVGWRRGGGISFNQGGAWDVHGGSQQRGPGGLHGGGCASRLATYKELML